MVVLTKDGVILIGNAIVNVGVEGNNTHLVFQMPDADEAQELAEMIMEKSSSGCVHLHSPGPVDDVSCDSVH